MPCKICEVWGKIPPGKISILQNPNPMKDLGFEIYLILTVAVWTAMAQAVARSVLTIRTPPTLVIVVLTMDVAIFSIC